MQNETCEAIPIFLGILGCGCMILFWAFVLTWQQIKFLKQDVEKGQKRTDELLKEILDLKYRK